MCDSCEQPTSKVGYCQQGHIVCEKCMIQHLSSLLTGEFRQNKWNCLVMNCEAQILPEVYLEILPELTNQVLHPPVYSEAEHSEAKAPETGPLNTKTQEEASEKVILQCPKCKFPGIVEYGCRHITCRCGCNFCNTCSEVTGKGYLHFCKCRSPSKTGKICQKCKKCLLYTESSDRPGLLSRRPTPPKTFEVDAKDLPARWEKRYTGGRPYYVNHATRNTTWNPPIVGRPVEIVPQMQPLVEINVFRLPADTEGLPPGWERRTSAWGRVFYVDHNTRSTTWYAPRM